MDQSWQLEPKDVKDEIEKLGLLIENTTKNVITFGIYRSVLERESAIRFLKEKITLPIVEFTLSKEKQNPLRLLSTLDNTKRSCVFFYEVDDAFPEFLGYVNLQRESFADFTHAIIFWVNEPTLKEIAIKAPDFWSWRRGVFDLRTEFIERTPEFLQFATHEEFIYQNPGDIERRISLYEGLRKEHLSQSNPDEKFLAELENKLAVAYNIIGKYNISENYSLEALSRSNKINDIELQVSSLSNLGQSARNNGEFKKSFECQIQALALVEKISISQHNLDNFRKQAIVLLSNNLGLLAIDMGDPIKGMEYFQKGLNIAIEYYGEQHQEVATSYSNIGAAWRHLGDSEKAISYYMKAIDIYLTFHGDINPRLAANYSNIGVAWYALNNYEKAIDFYEKALEIDLKIFGENHPDVAVRYDNLGLAWEKRGDLKKALDFLNKALKINLNLFGENHPNVARDYNNLGLVQDALGNLKDAHSCYTKSLDILLNFLPSDHPNIATIYFNLGSLSYIQADSKNAINYFTKAFDSYLKFYGKDHSQTKLAQANLEAAQKQLQ